MPRPVIGVTVDHNTRVASGDSAAGALHTQYLLPHAYTTAVEKAGGLPVMLPYRSDSSLIAQYVELCDGFIFSGGADYDPASFNESRHPMAEAIDPAREAFERALMAAVDPSDKPVLGICGGCQLMNLHRNGSLHQFIPDLLLKSAIEHRRFTIAQWSNRHDVNVESGTVLGAILNDAPLKSNSSHKQAVNKVGDSLRVNSRAPDGVVEGIEDPGKPFFVGVQWHPERQHDEPTQLAIFKELVRQASK